MFLEFHFWRYFFTRGTLFTNLAETETIRGFKKCVSIVLACTILLYILMNTWGMTTTSLTSLYVIGFTDTYTVARWISLVGITIFAVLYFCFHFFGVSQLLHIVTKVPLRIAAIMQLYVLAILLIEKLLVFVVFNLVGFTTPFSFLSFGPLAVQFLEFEYFHYFFNQFSVFTALIISIQYQFLRSFTDVSRKLLLIILLLMTAAFASIVALISIVPWNQLLAGGAI
ncbi:hypothetical protein ACF3OH_10980 [Chryseomicrobium aureum]|uniref:hypothetical protein n=1 Tax=Chryseomicrobium aureum TaxID=1441723 RepID=UPI00370D5CE0